MIIVRKAFWLHDHMVTLDGKQKLTFGDETLDVGCGYGCGYVIVPKNNKFYGKDSMDDLFHRCSIHGNITLSVDTHSFYRMIKPEREPEVKNILDGLPFELRCGWVFGFDTFHDRDTLENWPEEKVREESLKLKRYLYGE